MKFVFAVVMLALATSVQSSLIAHHAPGVSYVTSAVHPVAGHYGGPSGAGHWGAAVDHSGWAGIWGGPVIGHGHFGGYPGISLAQGHGHADLGLGHGAHGHGVYVAKTRGAVHTAPLAGHIASATSINVAPAPGTH